MSHCLMSVEVEIMAVQSDKVCLITNYQMQLALPQSMSVYDTDIFPFQISQIPSSITTILHDLSNRPNVLCTLIISREDGCIIHATGPASQSAFYQSPDFGEHLQVPMSSARPAQGQEVDIETNSRRREPTYTEKLAVGILEFVNAAVVLGSTLEVSHSEDGSNQKLDAVQSQSMTAQRLVGDDDEGTDGKEQEVQLLRLR